MIDGIMHDDCGFEDLLGCRCCRLRVSGVAVSRDKLCPYVGHSTLAIYRS